MTSSVMAMLQPAMRLMTALTILHAGGKEALRLLEAATQEEAKPSLEPPALPVKATRLAEVQTLLVAATLPETTPQRVAVVPLVKATTPLEVAPPVVVTLVEAATLVEAMLVEAAGGFRCPNELKETRSCCMKRVKS